MSKQVKTVSESGFQSTNQIGSFETTIDATGENAPDTLDTLLATYASCYVPALRVGGQQGGIEDLGRIEIETIGKLNDDDKLASIQFDIKVEEQLDDQQIDSIIQTANSLCKVHDAVKSQLKADITLTGGAF